MEQSNNLSLKLIQRCPACQAIFQQTMVTVLTETEFSLLAHLRCANCQVNLLANVMNTPQGLLGNAMLTDMTAPEAGELLDGKFISEDEFLDIYKFISKNNLINNLRSDDLTIESPSPLAGGQDKSDRIVQ